MRCRGRCGGHAFLEHNSDQASDREDTGERGREHARTALGRAGARGSSASAGSTARARGSARGVAGRIVTNRRKADVLLHIGVGDVQSRRHGYDGLESGLDKWVLFQEDAHRGVVDLVIEDERALGRVLALLGSGDDLAIVVLNVFLRRVETRCSNLGSVRKKHEREVNAEVRNR